MGKHFCRCGICDKDFNSSEEWVAHTRTPEHRMKVMEFRMMMIEAQTKGEHIDVRGFVRKIQRKAKTKKPQEHTKHSFIENISDAYAIVELYEYGTVDQRKYLEACRFASDYFEEKYGKDSFWFRELFAHMQSDEWESTFKVRCLLHAEVIGCPHDTIAECDKHKSMVELKLFKGKKCQHCRYIEGVEREWKEK